METCSILNSDVVAQKTLASVSRIIQTKRRTGAFRLNSSFLAENLPIYVCELHQEKKGFSTYCFSVRVRRSKLYRFRARCAQGAVCASGERRTREL